MGDLVTIENEGGVADVVLEQVGREGRPVLFAQTKLQVLACLWIETSA